MYGLPLDAKDVPNVSKWKIRQIKSAVLTVFVTLAILIAAVGIGGRLLTRGGVPVRLLTPIAAGAKDCAEGECQKK